MTKATAARGNVRGPAGPQGATGPQGSTGAQGATGPAGTTTLRGATDYDNSVAPASGQGVLWVPDGSGGGKFAPRSVVLPDDSRLTDSRTPKGHAPSHSPAGADSLTAYYLALNQAGNAAYCDVSVGSSSVVVSSSDSRLLLVNLYARNTAAQTLVTANAWTPVALPTEDFDDDAAHSTSTNTGRFTAFRAGRYRCSAVVPWTTGQSTTSPTRQARLVKNGTALPATTITGTYAATGLALVIPPILVTLAANDYVELQALSALANASVTGSASADAASMTVELIRAA